MDNENPTPQTGGLKLMTVFIVVLALHVLVIGGISAYHLFLKGDQTVAQKEADHSTTTDTIKTDDAGTAATASTTTPAIETDPQAGTNAPLKDETFANEKIAPVPSQVTATQVQPQPQTAPVVTAPAPVEQPVATTPSTTTASSSTYLVKAGDSLYKIARTHGTSVAELRKTNDLKTDALKIGQKLQVNGSTQTAHVTKSTAAAPQVAVTTQAPASVTDATSGTVYTVSKGDTIAKIARQFKTTPSAIMTANKLTDPKKLAIGAKLHIPTQEARNQTVPQDSSPKPLKTRPAQNSDLVMNK